METGGPRLEEWQDGAQAQLGIGGVYTVFTHPMELLKHDEKERILVKQVRLTSWRGKSWKWRTG